MSELLVQSEGDVLVLRFNRPAKANAINEPMQVELLRQLDIAAADPACKGVVLGAMGGKIYSAGADLKEFPDLDKAVAARRRRANLVRTLMALVDFPKPLVAAIEGKAIGGGTMIALLADEVLMAPEASLSMPEIRHGMPTPIGLAILAARGGWPAARRMVQADEAVGAMQALERGFADAVIGEHLVAAAAGRARHLGGFDAKAFAVNKRFANRELRAALQAAAEDADRAQD